MTQENMGVIFGNIPELAQLSDMLVERLEIEKKLALNSVMGDDRVGALFLEMVCRPRLTVFLKIQD